VRRKLSGVAVVACASSLVVSLGTGASADATYHTARIALASPTGAPGGGTVINIHADGPRVYAHEVYLLHGVSPGDYAITLTIYGTTHDCSGPVALALQTATVSTNAVGNGRSDVVFTPEQAAPLRGLTVSAVWTATGPADYTSVCSVITLD